MREEKLEVLSTDEKHTLKGFIYLPDGEIRGLVQIVHGMCEYLGRYKKFMASLCEAGYAAFGCDHLGHGETAEVNGDFGFIAEKDGWSYLVGDVKAVYESVKAKYGDKPYYLFGHSMGSFIVREAVIGGVKPEKLIVCGTGGPNPLSGVGLCLCKTMRAFKGPHHVSKKLESIAFGAYNKRFKEENDPKSWLTKDVSIRDKYRKDPFCTFLFEVSAMQDLIVLQNRANKEGIEKFPKELPVFLISGEEDPVGNYGKGVETVFQRMKKTGCNVSMKLYPNCRHEILNEDIYTEVLDDILSFIGGNGDD